MTALRKKDIAIDDDGAILGTPTGFSMVKDKKTLELCGDYVSRAWDGKRELRALAKNLGVTTRSLCALLVDTQKMGGKITRVLHVIFDGSTHMSSLLLEIGATCESLSKNWIIPCTEKNLESIRGKLSSFFGLVICMEGQVPGIFENHRFREVPKPGLNLHDDMVRVKTCVIKNAFVEARPQDKLAVESIYVFDSSSFVPIKDELITKMPWIVAQFLVGNGKTRYGMFNTITCRMDAVTFGHNSAGTKVLINRVSADMKSLNCTPHEFIEVC